MSNFNYTIQKVLIVLALFISSVTFAQTGEEILNNNSVLNLFNKGLSSSIIVSKIKTSKTNFDVSIDALIKLKEQKLPDEIVNAMVEAAGNKENATGDVNDPNSNHDSGIYYCKTADGKTEMTSLEPSVCAQAKMGSGIASSMTYGIAKTKMKAKLDGEMARIQLTELHPIFYFYFDKKQNMDNAPVWFSPSSSPNEFLLVKMDSKSKGREFVTGSVGVYSGTSWGVDDKYKVGFDIEKLKTGVYKVTPKGSLEEGEYCFMYAGNATLFGATGQGKVFDFGIKVVSN